MSDITTNDTTTNGTTTAGTTTTGTTTNGMLRVFREFNAEYEQVGTLTTQGDEATFSYVAPFLASRHANSIATILPLQSTPFSENVTRSFFGGLLPEGLPCMLFVNSLRLDTFDAYPELLAMLNHESSGALVFCGNDEDINEDITGKRAYTSFPAEDLERFSKFPSRVALEVSTTSRLALAGAQNKIGLYLDAKNHAGSLGSPESPESLGSRAENLRSNWYLPGGSAPSTHIVKAADGTFHLQTINEAFCLAVARRCGFDVADTFLIPLEGGSPLLAVKRFDRDVEVEDKNRYLNGLALPGRLHQEDFCQAAGLLSALKYEPTDGHYLELGASLINRISSNPFDDRMMLFRRVLFDYLIGNCDNHLKNHAFLWDADWKSCKLAPLYDITCTTIYPGLAREMGMSLCGSRRIDDVRRDDIILAAERIGIAEKMARQAYIELVEQFPEALAAAEKELALQGFEDASQVAAFVHEDSVKRRNW